MKITLNIELERPAALRGELCNLRAVDALVELLDGLPMVLYCITTPSQKTVAFMGCFEKEGDYPDWDDEDAKLWAIGCCIAQINWSFVDCEVFGFDQG